jgi:peptidyl-prolyl cis-trans isomerase C
MAAVPALLRDPLVSFFAVGAVLFAVDRARPVPDPSHRILVDDAFVRGLEEEAARRTGHVPDDAESAALVDAWIREEVLFREARALGLDRDDLVVRRRLVQKVELLLAAEAQWEGPTDDALNAYLHDHAADFRRDARTTLSLCFLSRELGDASARAAAALASPGEMRCDPHLPGDHFVARTDAQLVATLGATVAAALTDAPLEAWTGPIETSRGLYVVRVEAREPAEDATLDEVRPAVLGALVEERRAAAVSAREQELAAAYVVERAP